MAYKEGSAMHHVNELEALVIREIKELKHRVALLEEGQNRLDLQTKHLDTEHQEEFGGESKACKYCGQEFYWKKKNGGWYAYHIGEPDGRCPAKKEKKKTFNCKKCGQECFWEERGGKWIPFHIGEKHGRCPEWKGGQ